MIAITARPAKGFWRAGVYHPPQRAVYADRHFTDEQLAVIAKEPHLILETDVDNGVDLDAELEKRPEADAKEGEGGPNPSGPAKPGEAAGGRGGTGKPGEGGQPGTNQTGDRSKAGEGSAPATAPKTGGFWGWPTGSGQDGQP